MIRHVIAGVLLLLMGSGWITIFIQMAVYGHITVQVPNMLLVCFWIMATTVIIGFGIWFLAQGPNRDD